MVNGIELQRAIHPSQKEIEWLLNRRDLLIIQGDIDGLKTREIAKRLNTTLEVVRVGREFMHGRFRNSEIRDGYLMAIAFAVENELVNTDQLPVITYRSPAERRIVYLLTCGNSSGQICEKLNVEPKTLGYRIKRICNRYALNRYQLVAAAVETKR